MISYYSVGSSNWCTQGGCGAFGKRWRVRLLVILSEELSPNDMASNVAMASNLIAMASNILQPRDILQMGWTILLHTTCMSSSSTTKWAQEVLHRNSANGPSCFPNCRVWWNTDDQTGGTLRLPIADPYQVRGLSFPPNVPCPNTFTARVWI